MMGIVMLETCWAYKKYNITSSGIIVVTEEWKARLVHESCFSLQPGHYSSLTALNLQHTANQKRNDQYGN